jgi:hypothetical protein
MITVKDIWNDSVWSKVIAAGIIAIVGAIVAEIKFKWWERIRRVWSINVTMTGRYFSYQAGAGYPLKCHVEMRNDSSKCIEVRVSDYRPKAITLKSFPPEVMQVRFNNKWFPTDPVDRVAVLPGQLCRAWIGMDEAKFTEERVKAAQGNVGTLVVSANRKHFSFEL